MNHQTFVKWNNFFNKENIQFLMQFSEIRCQSLMSLFCRKCIYSIQDIILLKIVFLWIIDKSNTQSQLSLVQNETEYYSLSSFCRKIESNIVRLIMFRPISLEQEIDFLVCKELRGDYSSSQFPLSSISVFASLKIIVKSVTHWYTCVIFDQFLYVLFYYFLILSKLA